MTEHWLVRARLRSDAASALLAPLLVPAESNARLGASHRLIWSVLTDGPERKRDFLWRQTGPGAWIALTPRQPRDVPDIFDLDCKPFAPVLRPGQRLGFNLRANPVRAVAAPGKRGKRVDWVAHALSHVPTEDRPAARQEAVRDWLERQGARRGFTLEGAAQLRIEGEEWVRLPRPGTAPMTFSAVTLEGVLTVRDPAAFVAGLAEGFGSAKAFGCGLMLIRPAPPGEEAEGAEDDLA